jgi:hypothetical protein
MVPMVVIIQVLNHLVLVLVQLLEVVQPDDLLLGFRVLLVLLVDLFRPSAFTKSDSCVVVQWRVLLVFLSLDGYPDYDGQALVDLQ